MASLKQVVQQAVQHFNDVDDPLENVRLEEVEHVRDNAEDVWIVKLSGLEPAKGQAPTGAGPLEKLLVEGRRERQYRTIKLDYNTLELKGIALEHVDV